MRKRKAQILVEALSDKEKPEFLRWLEFELHGRQSTTLDLARGLIREDLISEIWPHIYPDRTFPTQPYNDSGLRRMEAQVSTHIEMFLTLQYLKEDTHLMEWKLLQVLNRKHADKLFVHRYNRTIRQMEQHELLDESYYQLRYRLEREWRYHLLKKGKRKKQRENLVQLNQHLEAWWLHEKMRAELINISQPGDAGTEGILVKEILDILAQDDTFDHLPLLNIYADLYRMLRSDDLSLAPVIQQWLENHYHLLQPDIVQDIFNFLHNYYVRSFNRTNILAYLESLWDLDQWGIKTQAILQDGLLPPALYRNLLETGLRLGETEQVWEYLISLKSMLPKATREEEFRFNLGGYYAKTGDYPMAMRTLGQKFSHPHKEINARLKLLRMRYEQGEREDLEYELRALREFCRRREEINPDFKRNAINDIKAFQALIKVFDSQSALKLDTKLTKMIPLGSKKWILEQLGAFG